jgi:hypothetical protein
MHLYPALGPHCLPDLYGNAVRRWGVRGAGIGNESVDWRVRKRAGSQTL